MKEEESEGLLPWRSCLEPALLLKVKKLNKAKIWMLLTVMEVGQNGE